MDELLGAVGNLPPALIYLVTAVLVWCETGLIGVLWTMVFVVAWAARDRAAARRPGPG